MKVLKLKFCKSLKISEDFVLKAEESREITVDSGEEIWVGFKSDAPFESFEKYKEDYPVKLEQKESGHYISSLFGGATKFKPKEGKIDLTISNSSKEDFKVVIYTKKD